MAEVKSDFLSEIRRCIGDKKYHMSPSGKIISSKKGAKPTFKNDEDREARDVRIKGFGGCGHMVPVVLDAIRVGLVERARGQSAGNRFVQLNARTLCKAVAGEDGKLVREYDFKAMVIAHGVVLQPDVTVTVEGGKVLFSQEKQESVRSSTNPKDTVYGMVLDATHEWAELVTLRIRGESGSTSFAIPSDWDAANIYIYIFAVFHDNRRASNSKCVYPSGD